MGQCLTHPKMKQEYIEEAGNSFQHFSKSYTLKDEYYHCLKSNATKKLQSPILHNRLPGEQGWGSGVSARLPPMCPGFPDPASYVDWVCWFSTLLREVFLRVLWFSPFLKKQLCQFPIRSWNAQHFWTSSWTSWCSVGKQITLLLPFFAIAIIWI